MMPADFEPGVATEALEREDYKSAFQIYMQYASARNSDAQVMVSCLYQTGLGVERNVLEAERWLLIATAQDNLVDWNNLGSMYAQKLPELKDRCGDAQKCWDRAKELGFKLAEPYPPPISNDESD
jgi:TPR repeat protein